jgi:DNA invertase Pin-like site-specific DNA recombinase
MNDLRNVFEKRAKRKTEPIPYNEIGRLELRRYAVVYKRLSTYEQLRTSRFSIERQHNLENIAIQDGYKPEMPPEEIIKIKEQKGYPGFYQNGQIIVIESDLGISGTKGQEDRPGLAMLIKLIEEDLVESIYIVEVARIFRDCHLITAPSFALLCKEHGVILVIGG